MSYAALNNCAFVSTQDLKQEGSKPFTFLMDAAMLGVGVGFDTLGAGEGFVCFPYNSPSPVNRYTKSVVWLCHSTGTTLIQQPRSSDEAYIVPDSREGWVESAAMVLDGYFFGNPIPKFDYSLIRPAGAPIKVTSVPCCRMQRCSMATSCFPDAIMLDRALVELQQAPNPSSNCILMSMLCCPLWLASPSRSPQ
jgi:hypothetical protein